MSRELVYRVSNIFPVFDYLFFKKREKSEKRWERVLKIQEVSSYTTSQLRAVTMLWTQCRRKMRRRTEGEGRGRGGSEREPHQHTTLCDLEPFESSHELCTFPTVSVVAIERSIMFYVVVGCIPTSVRAIVHATMGWRKKEEGGNAFVRIWQKRYIYMREKI